ncbi:MAG: DUF1598 domain-containing protein [Planctomycetota bacterium]
MWLGKTTGRLDRLWTHRRSQAGKIPSALRRVAVFSLLITALIQSQGSCVAQSKPALKPSDLSDSALKQVIAGDFESAAETLRKINAPAQRRDVLEKSKIIRYAKASLSSDNQYGSGNAGSATIRGGSQSGGSAAGAQGGGAFADFDSLMNLIETTIVPDTWEALGGNSTMAPYPQGVYVDAAGTIHEKAEVDDSGALENLKTVLAPETDSELRDWKLPAGLRCVSIRRLRDELGRLRISGEAPPQAVRFLAGLSEIRFVVFTEDDVLVAGPVGGIEMHKGWWVDRRTGRAAIRSDFLARSFSGAFSNTPFGCTIDPTVDGLRSAMEVGQQVSRDELPIGKAADAMVTALGPQRVEVFGTAGDTPAALLMVEADRHMKELALGKQAMPDQVPNYLKCIEQHMASGPPTDLLLRLWFTAQPQMIRSDGENTVFQLSETSPMKLSGQNQRALANGRRGNVAVDPRSQSFVDAFNQNFSRIRDEYPIYGGLESLYRSAAVAEVIRRYGDEGVHHPLALGLANEDEMRDWVMNTPRQVDSIATLHTVRHGRQRHHVLIASGGVSIAASSTLDKDVSDYPTLVSYRGAAKYQPAEIQQWWWDVK